MPSVRGCERIMAADFIYFRAGKRLFRSYTISFTLPWALIR